MQPWCRDSVCACRATGAGCACWDGQMDVSALDTDGYRWWGPFLHHGVLLWVQVLLCCPSRTCWLFKHIILEKSPHHLWGWQLHSLPQNCIKALPSYVLGTDKKICVMKNASLIKNAFSYWDTKKSILTIFEDLFWFSCGVCREKLVTVFCTCSTFHFWLMITSNPRADYSFPQPLLFS